jgi:hypothetical protein
MLPRLGLIAVWALVASCGETQRSAVQIDGGTFITGESKNKVPGVMFIGNCSSTAVSTNTLVTAAHCVVSGGQVSRQVCIRSGNIANGKCSTKILVPEPYRQREFFPNDVAVIVFDDAPFTKYFEMADRLPAVGDSVLMVGYSDDNRGNAAADKGSKRWGKNTIASVSGDNRTTIVSRFSGSSNGVAVSPGDSGGPLFKDCRLIGVASRMSTGGAPKTSLHTNILGDNRDFMNSLTAQGAYYCGLTGRDSRFCPAAGRATPITNPGRETEGEGFPCSESPVDGGGGDGNINNPPPQTGLSLFAALGRADGSPMYVTSDTQLTSIKGCRGAVDTCATNELGLTLSGQTVRGLTAYRSFPLRIVSATTISIEGLAADGRKAVVKLRIEAAQ